MPNDDGSEQVNEVFNMCLCGAELNGWYSTEYESPIDGSIVCLTCFLAQSHQLELETHENMEEGGTGEVPGPWVYSTGADIASASGSDVAEEFIDYFGVAFGPPMP